MILEYKDLTLEDIAHLAEAVNTEENPVQYLGIDPGKANGVCGYNAKFYLQFMFTIKSDDMVKFLAAFKKVKKCIMENYKLFPNKAKDQYYSDMETPRVIGRVEAWAETNGVELITQPPTIKSTGYKWIGQKPLPKSNPWNHPMDAHVHLMYWAIKNKYIHPSELLKRSTLPKGM